MYKAYDLNIMISIRTMITRIAEVDQTMETRKCPAKTGQVALLNTVIRVGL